MNKLKTIVIDRDTDGNIDDFTFYFTDSDEPWTLYEFGTNTTTYIALKLIIDSIRKCEW